MPRQSLVSTLLLAVLVSASGCTLCEHARLVAYEEPKLFNERCDKKISMATYRAMADQAWQESGAACPENCYAGDYAWGFREGFAEFVYAGGTGEPPAVPPRPYWQVDVRTGEGATAIRSWFEGYRHGARLARDGGYRDATTLTVSASLRDCDECGCPDDALRTRHARTSVEALPNMAPTERAEIILPEPNSSGDEPATSTPELQAPARLPEPAPPEAPPVPQEPEEPGFDTPIFEATDLTPRESRVQPVNALFPIVH